MAKREKYLMGVGKIPELRGKKVRLGDKGETEGIIGFCDEEDNLVEIQYGTIGVLTGMVGVRSVKTGGFTYAEIEKNDPCVEFLVEVEWPNGKRCFWPPTSISIGASSQYLYFLEKVKYERVKLAPLKMVRERRTGKLETGKLSKDRWEDVKRQGKKLRSRLSVEELRLI